MIVIFAHLQVRHWTICKCEIWTGYWHCFIVLWQATLWLRVYLLAICQQQFMPWLVSIGSDGWCVFDWRLDKELYAEIYFVYKLIVKFHETPHTLLKGGLYVMRIRRPVFSTGGTVWVIQWDWGRKCVAVSGPRLQ